MTDGKRLEEEIRDSGISITHIATKMGCSRNRVYSIIHGGECTASEIVALSEILHFDEDTRNEIFLRENVIDNHTMAANAV